MRIDVSFLPALAGRVPAGLRACRHDADVAAALGALNVPVRLTVAVMLAAVLLPLHQSAYALDLISFDQLVGLRTRSRSHEYAHLRRICG